MIQRNYLHFVSAGLLYFFLCCLHIPLAAQGKSDWNDLQDILGGIKAEWTSVPAHIVNTKFSTGMLLGNGDIGVVVGDTLNRQTFYFGKSDFWGAAVKRPDDPSSVWQASILSLGGLTIGSPGKSPDTLSGFHIEEDIQHAEVRTIMPLGRTDVKMTSWTADADKHKKNNFFITRLTSHKDVLLHLSLWVPSTYKYGGKWLDCSPIYPYSSGSAKDLLWVTRQNYNDSHADRHGEYKARAAMAVSLKGTSFQHTGKSPGEISGNFMLKAGIPVYVVVAFSSAEASDWKTCPAVSEVRNEAIGKAGAISIDDLILLKKGHERWWRNYWMRSYVNLNDSLLNDFYYGSLYVLGCASRTGSFPPSLFGNWITTDRSSWGGRYFLNYNEEAAYYGVASSNRPELMLPYIHLILHEANWQENKTHTAGYEGICHQRSMTPYDLIAPEPAVIPVAAGKDYKRLPADQKSNGAFAAMPLIWYYEYTRDTAYLRTKLYPYLKKLEAFYDDYMDKSSKPYHIYHSSAHEGSDDMDPNLDIGFCRRLCTLLIRESRTLHTDSAMRKIWQDDLDHLATYPTMMRNGEQVYTESATKNGSTDPDKLFHAGDQPINLEGGVFPGENIHIGGDSISLQIARNSLAQVGGWCVNRGGSENNGFPKVWPIAARIGWPANDLIKKLKAAILFHWRASNLTAFQGGGGIETAGAIEGINSMLMQSEGSIIRVFPDWPLTKNASFTKLRAKGAFLVSSELKNGEVPYIHIQSEQGGMVTLMDPWQDGTVKVFEINGKAKKAISFKELKNNISFNTIKGQSYFISNNGRKIRVNNTDDISEAMQSAKPGDTLVMQNGIWKDQKIIFEGNGTENNPIVLMAETPGSVILSGTSSLNMAGHWLEANGLVFRSGYIQKGSIVNFKNGKDSAYHCRLTNTVIEQYKAPNDTIETHWISLYGTHNRVDHCQLSGKSNEGTTLVVWLNGTPNYDRIDHNHFGPRPPLGRNGGEIIRVGTSTWSMTNSYTTVEDNYFEKCDGEIEVISNKSCHNIYRHNTFYACQGTLTLRHGNDVLVENNFFFGNNETESGGVRIIGAHHTVIHNYFQDLSGTGLRAAISVMNAQQHPALNGYWPVKDVTIADNVIVSCKQGIVMGSGAGERGRVMAPANCRIYGNKIFNKASPKAFSGVAVQPVTKADTGPEWIVH